MWGAGGRWQSRWSWAEVEWGWSHTVSPSFPLRQAELEGQDGTGLQGRTRGHFITESVCPEDGKRIILQTGFIGGDNSLAEPTLGNCHIGWGYNIASFTVPNCLIFSNACARVHACEIVERRAFVEKWTRAYVCGYVSMGLFVCGLSGALQKSSVAIDTVTWLVLLLVALWGTKRLFCWFNR